MLVAEWLAEDGTESCLEGESIVNVSGADSLTTSSAPTQSASCKQQGVSKQ